jgi:very-short-patch-repair endonuclease
LRASPSDAERTLWRELRLKQFGAKFRRQHPVGKYVVDFACLEYMLCIEVDGAHHSAQAGYDRMRTEFLRSNGYTVLRFTDREVLTSIESVKESIWKTLQSLKPPPP